MVNHKWWGAALVVAMGCGDAALVESPSGAAESSSALTGIDPSAVISPSAQLGVGVAIGARAVIGRRVRVGDYAVIGAGSQVADDARIGARAVLGDGVVVGQRTSLGDDTQVADFGYLYADVQLGAGVELGKRAVVRPRSSIGDGSRFGDDLAVNSDVRVGRAVQGGSGVSLQPRSVVLTEVRLGQGVALNSDVVLGDRAELGDRVTVNTRTRIGGFTRLGVGARVSSDAMLGRGVQVGAGATISNFTVLDNDTTVAAGGKVPSHGHLSLPRAACGPELPETQEALCTADGATLALPPLAEREVDAALVAGRHYTLGLAPVLGRYEGVALYTPSQSGPHTLLVGDGAAALRVVGPSGAAEAFACDEDAASCAALPRGRTLALSAGVTYRIELGPLTTVSLTLAIAAPDAGSAEPPALRLGAARTFAAGTTPESIASADLDGDGALDLVLSTPDDASGLTTLDFLQGTGDGSFQMVRQVFVSAPGRVVLADFDRDGQVDVAASAWDGQGALPGSFLKGLGGFGYTRTPWGDRDYRPGLTSADLDEDGVPELVAPYFDGEGTGAAGFTVLGVPGFALRADVVRPPEHVALAATGDFDGDGHADVVTSSLGLAAGALYRGDGAGGLAAVSDVPALDGSARFLSSVRLGEGGASTLVASGLGAELTLLAGGPSGLGAPRRVDTGLSAASSVVSGDFNRDGRPDLAVAGWFDDRERIAVLLGSDGGFVHGGFLRCTRVGSQLVVGDFDRDGFDDLAAPSDGAAAVFLSSDGT